MGLLGFLNLNVYFLAQFGKLSAIISSNKLFAPFSFNFSCALLLCVRIHTFDQTGPISQSLWTGFIEGSLPVSPARDSGGLSNLFIGWAFSGLVYVCKFPIREVFLNLLFPRASITLFRVAFIFSSACSLDVHKLPSSFLFSVASRHLDYSGFHQHFKMVRQKLVP